ncbi:MAG: HisA/HisF-related TIM barrel protein [Candidatus Binatia bacterium]|nr:HisA/HisF-related TIM barrel protein [Candidatus Binatia bacterium]
MLKTRIIPVLLANSYDLVKGQRFNAWRRVGHVLQAARVHEMRQVDELILLDIGATARGGPNFDLVRALTKDCFMPLSVGGGISTLEHIREMLRSGADKVVLGTTAVERPEFINAASDRFGAQAIVVSVDAKDGFVWSRNGTRRDERSPLQFACEMQDRGAGEILLNAVDRDGTLTGYDLDLIREVSAAVRIPLVAAGGCSGYEDMAEALRAGAHAVSAGALFQFCDSTPRGAAEHLTREGFVMRKAA